MVGLDQHVVLLFKRDPFVGERAMLQAVVQVEFTRLEAFTQLPVQPELVAVSGQSRWLAIHVERQQVRLQAFGKVTSGHSASGRCDRRCCFANTRFVQASAASHGLSVDTVKIECSIERT